jgi:hypothetical protein
VNWTGSSMQLTSKRIREDTVHFLKKRQEFRMVSSSLGRNSSRNGMRSTKGIVKTSEKTKINLISRRIVKTSEKTKINLISRRKLANSMTSSSIKHSFSTPIRRPLIN